MVRDQTFTVLGFRGPVLWILLVAVLAPGRGWTQEEPEKELGWFDEAELSLVATGGNSETETLSLRNTLKRVWRNGELRIGAGALRAESTTLTRTAVGTSTADAQVVESSTTAVTADSYYLNGRYDRRLSERFFWFGGAGWERDEPAGVRNRVSIAVGVGNVWFDREEARFRTDYAVTYTDQEDVVEAPSADAGFLGARLSWSYWRRLTATTTYGNELVVDENLDETSDLRAVMTNAVSVTISETLALKLSHEARFDNQPALVAVPIRTPAGQPLGQNVLVEVDELDTLLSIALVATF